MFNAQRERLLNNLAASHDMYYASEVFGGPCLHFHHQSLSAGASGDGHDFAQKVYAVLATWGMHRMGSGGAKMCEFDMFFNSLKRVWPVVLELQNIEPHQMDNSTWQQLRSIFCALTCMATRTSLVANSKVLAHALPKLVAPIDREYTLRFLYGTGAITNGIARECDRFVEITKEFFHPFLEQDQFRAQLAQWSNGSQRFHWDTSPLKVVDNLVIGWMRQYRPRRRRQRDTSSQLYPQNA